MSKFYLFSLASISAILVALTGCNSSQTTSPSPSTSATQSPAVTTELTATTETKDADYMVSLGLMKGHLIVAKELLDQGKPDQAGPHVGHPVEEIYADVESELSARKVPEFKTTLNQLHELVKSAPKDPKLATQYEAAIKAIDQAIAAVPETKRQSPEFVLEVINGLLDTANEEYEAAISEGKFSEIIEYQDSRGFVIYAETLYQSISESIQKDAPNKAKIITASFAELKKAWPSAIPPTSPVITSEKVSQLIETIKKNS
ncbi:MAG: hypothetical protein HC768_12800 [Acaryochloris sp. CRU_2_0]|nr:hypothetical protein [Acaryochloris sp. CRU_2_0]